MKNSVEILEVSDEWNNSKKNAKLKSLTFFILVATMWIEHMT